MGLEDQFKNFSLTSFLDVIRREDFHWVIKRLSGNDTNLTGAHQVGLYLPKSFMKCIFPEIARTDVLNPDAVVTECYFPGYDYLIQDLRAIYYNSRLSQNKKGGRNEFRITNWGGKKSPNQDPENTGAIFIFATSKSESKGKTLCWVAEKVADEDLIEEWLGEEVEPGRFYMSFQQKRKQNLLDKIQPLLENEWNFKFPSGEIIFDMVIQELPHQADIDKLLLKRREVEFEMFKTIENLMHLSEIQKGFDSVDDFVRLANSITGRRKSRSGRSLENNLSHIFLNEHIKFEEQVVTEDNYKPDFIFPSGSAYHGGALTLNMLASKTCCKDRWRQITKEAARIETKHLFTLQDGISSNQLTQMAKAKVVLVVPKGNMKSYPKDHRDNILSLREFVDMRRKIQQMN